MILPLHPRQHGRRAGRRACSRRILTLGVGALLLSDLAAGSARTERPAPTLALTPTPRASQFVVPPEGVESGGFAKKARALPILAGPILAPAWVLMDAGSGRVLAGHNIDKKMFPASTTKTMTALLAVESGRLDDLVVIGPNPPLTGEASIYLQKGEKFLLRDLVKAALIRSANDSCVAVAEAVAGSVPKFVGMMNARAKALGAIHTHFVNPHGLHNPQHFTTPRDLALIARHAMSLPTFASIARRREEVIFGVPRVGPGRLLLNRNRLLFRWAGCDGVKTGYTRQAGHCLIASSTQAGADGKPWRLIAVVMHSPDSWSDAYNALVHEGFEKFTPQVLARAGQEFSLSRRSDTSPEVPSRLRGDVRVALRAGEEAQARVVPERAARLGMPLSRGERVARAEWVVGGRVVADAPLFATSDAPAAEGAGSAVAGAPQDRPARSSAESGLMRNRALIVGSLLLGAVGLGLAALFASRSRSRG